MKQSLGTRLKALRDAYRLSQDEFGAMIGVTNMAINRIESGKTEKPQVSTLKKIVKVYGTTHEWLTTGKGEMLPDGLQDLSAQEQESSGWKDEAWLMAKSQLEKKDNQLDRLSMAFDRLTKMMQDSGVSFLRPVAKTGTE